MRQMDHVAARLKRPLHLVKHSAARLLDRTGLLRRLPWLRNVGRPEVIFLLCALFVVMVVNWLIELADDVQEGDTSSFDEWAVRSFRQPDDPATPIGPAWVREVGIDVTALGSHAVVLMVVFAVAGFLALRRLWRPMWLVLAASLGGMMLSAVTKELVGRERPDVVPHLREVMTPSFPSGHATLAAAVYMTLGAVLAQIVSGRYTRLYCLLLPASVVIAVGLSRVYLGVHYPTDVLAGWALGLAWAVICWAVANYLKQRGLLHLWRGARH
jgi:undecaprenyl-diphosphatase